MLDAWNTLINEFQTTIFIDRPKSRFALFIGCTKHEVNCFASFPPPSPRTAQKVIKAIALHRNDFYALTDTYEDLACAFDRALVTRNAVTLRKLLSVARDRLFGWRGGAALARIAIVPQQTMDAWLRKNKLPRLNDDSALYIHKGMHRLATRFHRAAATGRPVLQAMDKALAETRRAYPHFYL